MDYLSDQFSEPISSTYTRENASTAMSNEIINPSNPNQLPAYLQGEKAKQFTYDMSKINENAKPPFVKIIQAQAGAPYSPPFVTGDVIVAPLMQKIADTDNGFTFTPLHFFVHYTVINPFKMRGQLPVIREQSFDPNSEIAKKAERITTEPCPENPEYKIQYCKVLNFITTIEGVHIPGIWLFFNRGEFANGRAFLGIIQSLPAPMFICRFRATPTQRVGKEGKWIGLNITPDPSLYEPDEEKAIKNKKLSDHYVELVNRRELDLSEGMESVQDEPDNSEMQSKYA